MTLPRVPLFRPSMDGMLDAIASTLEVGWLGMGPETLGFERELAQFLGVDASRVVCTGTGTAALHAALAVADIGPGDEVILPALNFVADAQAVLATGADVVLCDVNDIDLCLDVEKCADLIGPRTRAIMPLHYAGWVSDSREWGRLAQASPLRIVEDATHSLGSRHPEGKLVGSVGDLVCFSFDPVKVITSLDGGAVVAATSDDASALRRFRDLGISRESHERHSAGTPWSYDVTGHGLRYHLNSVSAAVGRSQLRQLHQFIADRRRLCQQYDQGFQDVAHVRTPPGNLEFVSPFIYYVRVPADRRDGVRSALAAAGIASGMHFPPINTFDAFRTARSGDLSTTGRAVQELITLPLFVGMTADDVDLVVSTIRAELDAI